MFLADCKVSKSWIVLIDSDWKLLDIRLRGLRLFFFNFFNLAPPCPHSLLIYEVQFMQPPLLHLLFREPPPSSFKCRCHICEPLPSIVSFDFPLSPRVGIFAFWGLARVMVIRNVNSSHLEMECGGVGGGGGAGSVSDRNIPFKPP